MKELYTFLTAAALIAVVNTSAQETAMPYPKKSLGQSEQNSALPSSQSRPLPRIQQDQNLPAPLIPVEDQIHSPIRWYAIENADNPDYWKHVNTSRIWLELELGVELSNAEIAAFLIEFELGDPVKQSMHPHATNFFVFEKAGATAQEVLDMAKSARTVPGVLFLEPSVIYKGSATPNDPLWNTQWGPYAIFADEAWDYGTQGENSWNVLAVVDDAIDWQHEDLSDQVWYGYDYGFNDDDPSLDVADEQAHGTHVTGIMSASNNNGIGIAGMCTDTVFFAKVTDNSYFINNGAYSSSAIIDALYDIGLNLPRVSVINLSLGGGAPSDAAEQAYNFVWNNGKLPIVASGNEGSGSISFPAAYPACMAVGSIGTDGNEFYRAIYSNYGPEQEVTAPGGDLNTGYGIVSTMPWDLYDVSHGTSMACPHVAGLAGLMKSLNPDLSNSDIREMIHATCYDLGPAGWDEDYGHGMVNAKLALDLALGGVSTNDLESMMRLKMYPNPAADRLWVDIEDHAGSGEFQIFDLNGRMLNSGRASNALFSVDISQFGEGVYVLHLSTRDHHYTGRFVKSN